MTPRFAYLKYVMQCALVCLPQLGAAETEPGYAYDWVPLSELTEEQKAKLGPSCRGAYIDPLAKEEPTDPANTEIEVVARESNMAQGQILLQGNVEITQGERRLEAEHMSYDQATGHAKLEGKVQIRHPGIWVKGDKAEVNMGDNYAEFAGGEFVLHGSHMRGAAGQIKRESSGVVILREGEVTSCEPGNESWIIKGKQITLNPATQQGSGRNLAIYMAGVPIFYAPYLTFPIGNERQTGLLVPSIGTSEGGIDFAQPFYWNIAPNMDATFSPRYASGHGAMLETEFRYLNHFSENAVTVAYLADDEGGGDPDVDKAIEDGVSEELLRPYKGEDRWVVDFTHHGGDVSHWYSDIQYTKASDIDYFRDLAVASFEVSNNTYLSQSAVFGYRVPNWLLQVRLQEYQTLLADVNDTYSQLPRITATGKYPLVGLELSLKNDYVHFAHEDPEFITGDRINLDYQLNWNRHSSYGFLNPNLGIQALAYNLESEAFLAEANQHPAFITPYASVDAGLIFERADGLQTLEPRVFYLYRAYEDQSDLFGVLDPASDAPKDVNFDTTNLTFGYHQLFRDHRFSGGDRLDDANQLTLGVSSRWMAAHDSDLALDVNFGQIIYFQDREVQLVNSEDTIVEAESDLAAQVAATLNENLSLYSNFLYNPKTKKVMRSTNGVSYRSGHNKLLNVGYRYVREDTVSNTTLPVDQVDTSFVWPIGEQWQLVGRLFYDLDENRELDTFIGFEYDDCCYRVRLLARRWLDSKLADLVDDEQRHYDEAIFLEFDLKGLASSGESISKLLSDSIPGFDRLGR